MLAELLQILDSHQQAGFLQFLDQKNKRTDVKNLELVQALIQNKEASFKSSMKVGAYHALNKRVKDQLISFVASISSTRSFKEANVILNYLLTARLSLSEGHFKLGFQLLNKAEVLAVNAANYALLNEIYHSAIEFSYASQELKVHDLFKKLKENNQRYMEEESLNFQLALTKKVMLESGFDQNPELIKASWKGLLKELPKRLNYKLFYQMVAMLNLKADANSAHFYLGPDLFKLEEQLNQFPVLQYHKSYQLKSKYELAYLCFRKLDFEQALKRGAQLELDFKQEKGGYLELKAKNTLLIQWCKVFTGGINEKNIKWDHNTAVSQLSKALFLFLKGDVIGVKKVFLELHHSDQYYLQREGLDWLAQYKLMFVLLQMELEHYDLAASQLLSFERKILKKGTLKKGHPVFLYLKMLKKIINEPFAIQEDAFKKVMNQDFDFSHQVPVDIWYICFYSWMQAKMERGDLYSTVLNNIAKAVNKVSAF